MNVMLPFLPQATGVVMRSSSADVQAGLPLSNEKNPAKIKRFGDDFPTMWVLCKCTSRIKQSRLAVVKSKFQAEVEFLFKTDECMWAMLYSSAFELSYPRGFGKFLPLLQSISGGGKRLDMDSARLHD